MQNFEIMKKISAVFLFISIVFTTNLAAQKPHFYITAYGSSGDSSLKYAIPFERLVQDRFKDAFPCADVVCSTDIRHKLERLYAYQFIGDNDNPGDDLTGVGNDLAHDYWVPITLRDYTMGMVSVEAKCFKYKKVDCIAWSEIAYVPNDFKSITEGCKKVTKQLVDKLGDRELCPFKGPVTITMNSVKDTVENNEYGVYCNEMDQQFHHKLVTNNNTYSEWNLERKGIPWTGGTMTFYTNETSDLLEENGCYLCKSGREGGRTYTVHKSFKVQGSGISHESERNGKRQEDTRIELEFLSDGTYFIIVKGTSLPVTGEEKITEKAEGTCDNMPEETKVLPREMSVPLWAVFGPYPGKPLDKILQHKDKIVKKNFNDEKSTITIDFTLSKN
jgi:hypothetical protein